jgi:hypothetical protein
VPVRGPARCGAKPRAMTTGPSAVASPPPGLALDPGQLPPRRRLGRSAIMRQSTSLPAGEVRAPKQRPARRWPPVARRPRSPGCSALCTVSSPVPGTTMPPVPGCPSSCLMQVLGFAARARSRPRRCRCRRRSPRPSPPRQLPQQLATGVGPLHSPLAGRADGGHAGAEIAHHRVLCRRRSPCRSNTSELGAGMSPSSHARVLGHLVRGRRRRRTLASQTILAAGVRRGPGRSPPSPGSMTHAWSWRR